MKLAALVVVAFLFAVTGDARAGGGVDWSEYLDDGSKVPASKTPQIAVAAENDEPAAAPAEEATKRTAKVAKAKKGKKTSKAKAAKAKTRAKAKKRRR